jgi:ribosome-associated translation inhibitor RaiA
MANHDQLIQVLNAELALDLPEKISFETMRERLSETINYLITNNFQKLLTVLYRIDVSEQKLKLLLQKHSDVNAGMIIADLVIERQLQKLKSRGESRNENNNISENEKW